MLASSAYGLYCDESSEFRAKGDRLKPPLPRRRTGSAPTLERPALTTAHNATEAVRGSGRADALRQISRHQNRDKNGHWNSSARFRESCTDEFQFVFPFPAPSPPSGEATRCHVELEAAKTARQFRCGENIAAIEVIALLLVVTLVVTIAALGVVGVRRQTL